MQEMIKVTCKKLSHSYNVGLSDVYPVPLLNFR